MADFYFLAISSFDEYIPIFIENFSSKLFASIDNGNNKGMRDLDHQGEDINITRNFQEEVLASAKSNLTSNQKGYSSGLSSGGNLNLAETKPVTNAEKPLLRRKSELPTDQFTQRELEMHKRADEFLTTPPPDTN